MRHLITSLGILAGSLNFIFAATTRTPQEIIDQTEIKRPRYVLKTELLDVIVLNMPYGENYVISEIDKKLLQKAEVQMIDLVFSDFPKGQDMKKLNLSRIQLLADLRKSLITDETIQWKVIRQIDCKNEGEAKTLFHGIIIHYKPIQTEEDKLREISAINAFLPEESKIRDISKVRKNLQDSTVIKILERNKEWENMTIVADFTGSMSPYAAQLVLWFKLKSNDKRVKNVAFFNDGNMTPDMNKKLGATGGIYFSNETTYESIRKLAIETISNGGGGDGPENNIEALIYSLKKAPGTKDLIMVADNTAPVKDIELLGRLDQPVHIILCGTRFGINTDYLNIARKTGGSVHTMEKDLVDLIKKNEGEKFEFNGEKFEIVDGNIVKVRTI